MKSLHILLLEDEPVIAIDLQFAADDRGCSITACATTEEAKEVLEQEGTEIDVAVLDVSLGEGETCFPTAKKLEELGIPFLLHSGDLDRFDERIGQLNAELIAKPALAETVIGAAVALAYRSRNSKIENAAAE